jgi:hypothetical protein
VENKDPLDLLDQQAQEVNLAHKGKLGPKVNREDLDLLENLEDLVIVVSKALLDQLVVMADLDQVDQLVQEDLLESEENKDQQDHQDLEENQDQVVLEESLVHKDHLVP